MLQTYTRNGERHLEIFAIALYHFKERVQCRHVRTFGDVAYATLVFIIVIIIMVSTYIKETIAFEMYYLVNLKI